MTFRENARCYPNWGVEWHQNYGTEGVLQYIVPIRKHAWLSSPAVIKSCCVHAVLSTNIGVQEVSEYLLTKTFRRPKMENVPTLPVLVTHAERFWRIQYSTVKMTSSEAWLLLGRNVLSDNCRGHESWIMIQTYEERGILKFSFFQIYSTNRVRVSATFRKFQEVSETLRMLK